MDFKNRLKGKVTQGLLETLLEDVKYKIVPLGIEEVVREIKTMDQNHYLSLGLSQTLRRLPDFLIARPDFSKNWLVEVKYRTEWNKEARASLGRCLVDQVKQWQPVHLVLFLGKPARLNETPASYLGVCELFYVEETLCFVRRSRTGDGVTSEFKWEEFYVPWEEVTWDDMKRFQDVFDGISNRWEGETLLKSIQMLKPLGEL